MWFSLLKTSSGVQHHLRSSFMTLKAFLMCRGLRVTGPCLSDPSSFSSACGQSLVHLKGDISRREKAGNNPYHQDTQDNKQHAPERTIFRLYTSAVETTSLYKRRNKQHQPELQLNSVSHLYSFTFQAISHTHTRTFAYTAETLAHCLSQEEHVDCFLCLTLGAPHVLSLSLTLNFLFFFFFLSNCSRTTSRIKPLAKV